MKCLFYSIFNTYKGSVYCFARQIRENNKKNKNNNKKNVILKRDVSSSEFGSDNDPVIIIDIQYFNNNIVENYVDNKLLNK